MWTVVEDTYVLNLAGRGVYSTAVPGEHHHVREAAVVATVALEWLTEVRMLNIVGQHRMENKDIGDGQPSCGCCWTSERQMKVRINRFD